MKYIKIYESFAQANPTSLDKIKSEIESGIESEVKPPIYLDSSQETPGLVKFLSELVGDKLMDMMIINLDQLSLQELKDSFPKEVPMDKGGIIFIDGIGQARPENKKMLSKKSVVCFINDLTDEKSSVPNAYRGLNLLSSSPLILIRETL